MKLSSDTITILKNFADINDNLMIKPGNMLKTVHVPPTIYGEAQVSEVFDKFFGIYNLKEFLATIAMFKNPDLTFNDEYVEIIDEDDKTIRTKYFSADANILTKTPEFKKFPDPSVTFKITDTNFRRIQRASSTLQRHDIVIAGSNGKITAKVCDLSNATKNEFTVILDDQFVGEDFEVHMKQEKLCIIGGDYNCSLLADNKIMKAVHTEKNISYLITMDVN